MFSERRETSFESAQLSLDSAGVLGRSRDHTYIQGRLGDLESGFEPRSSATSREKLRAVTSLTCT